MVPSVEVSWDLIYRERKFVKITKGREGFE